MGGQNVPPDAVWKALRQGEMVVKAMRGEGLPAATFAK
jgi:hypothetical protein